MTSIGEADPRDRSQGPEVDDAHELLAISVDMSQEDFLLSGGVSGMNLVDDDDDEAYVPDSLKAFVEEQKNKLNQARDSFFSAMLPDPDLSLINSVDDAEGTPLMSFPDLTVKRSSPRLEAFLEGASAPAPKIVLKTPESSPSKEDPVVTSPPDRIHPPPSKAAATPQSVVSLRAEPVRERESPSLPSPSGPASNTLSVTAAPETIPELPPSGLGAKDVASASEGPTIESPTVTPGDKEDERIPTDPEPESSALDEEDGRSLKLSGPATDVVANRDAIPAIAAQPFNEVQLPPVPQIGPETTPTSAAATSRINNVVTEGLASSLSKGKLPEPSPVGSGGAGRTPKGGSARSANVKRTQVAPLPSSPSPSQSTAMTNPSILRTLTDRLTRPTASSTSRRRTPRAADQSSKVPVSTPSPTSKPLTLHQPSEEQIVSPLSDPSVSPSTPSSTLDAKSSPRRKPNSLPRTSPSPMGKNQKSKPNTPSSRLQSHLARSPGTAAVQMTTEFAAESPVTKHGDVFAKNGGQTGERFPKAQPESPRQSNLFATRATLQCAPRISSPSTLTPGFLGRLTQPTAASRARSAATLHKGRQGSNEEMAPSPRRVTSSCESCSSSPSKESNHLPGTSPAIKITGASPHLTRDTEASKARRSPKDAPVDEAASPLFRSSPPQALLSRLARETAASRARNSGVVTAVPFDAQEQSTERSAKDDAVRHSDHRSLCSSPSRRTGVSPQRSSLSRLTQETASSLAHKMCPPQHCDSTLVSKPKTNSSPSIRSTLKSIDPSMAPSDEMHNNAHTRSGASHEILLAQTRSFDEMGSITIPNACSSLTQDSMESGRITSQSALSTLAASKTRKGEHPPSKVRHTIQLETKSIAPESLLSSQSRLLQGTASSRARANPVLPPSSASTERSRNLKQDQKKKAVSLAIDRARRKSGVAANAAGASAREGGERLMHPTQKRKASDEKENRAMSQTKHSSAVLTSRSVPPTRTTEKRTTSNVVPTLAQSTDVLRSALRSDQSIGTARSTSTSVRRPTIPETPNFATSKRYGGKEVPKEDAIKVTLAQSTDLLVRGLRSDSSMASMTGHRRQTPTIPQSPHFATSTRCGFKTPKLREQNHDVALVNSTQLLKSGLRAPDPALLKRRELKLTVPITPKFHAKSMRKPQKSTEERELELIERYRSNPFKARSTTRSAPSTARVEVQEALREAEVRKFQIETEDPQPFLQTSRSQEEEDLREMKKQFRARPAPKFAPKAIVMQKRLRSAKKSVPLASASVKSPSFLMPRGPLTTSSVASNATAPNLSTPGRSAKRQAVAEASRRKAEAMALQREKDAKDRQRERIRQEILKAEAGRLSVPANSKPFVLRSELRGEQHQRRFEEKVRQEEEERRRLASFHAREYQKSATPPDRKRPERIITAVQPFNLSSLARHEEFEGEFLRKLAEEEEELRRQSQFKAKPVPKTTYCYTPIASPAKRSPWSTRSTGSAKNYT